MSLLDENGKPLDKSYLECNLPSYLQKDIDALIGSKLRPPLEKGE